MLLSNLHQWDTQILAAIKSKYKSLDVHLNCAAPITCSMAWMMLSLFINSIPLLQERPCTYHELYL